MKLILLPGLGADKRLFCKQQSHFPQLIIPDWLIPTQNEPLSQYASRFAGLINEDENFILGGVSFGGILAYEMTHFIRPSGLLLISVCLEHAEIQPYLRMLAPLNRFSILSYFVRIRLFGRSISGLFGANTRFQKKLFAEMLATADRRMLEWAPSAIMNWQPKKITNIPLERIHGSSDKIVSLNNSNKSLIVNGAGHLVNITHWKVVNRFIEEFIIKIAKGRLVTK